MNKFSRFALVVVVALLSAGPAAACFDVSQHEPHHLVGVLSHRIFPGSPGFADVRKGDAPEPGYLLKLDSKICLIGDDFADPKLMFDEVQLVSTDATDKKMHGLEGARVEVELSDPMPAMTGHHHRPLVAWVTRLEAAAADPTADYGTAATVVRAFYDAPAEGRGAEAAGFIVPERRRGPFAPDAMSKFYGGLKEPLKLRSLAPDGPNRRLASYSFAGAAGRCEGRASVTTTTRGGENFIESIRALDGC